MKKWVVARDTVNDDAGSGRRNIGTMREMAQGKVGGEKTVVAKPRQGER